MHRTTRSQTFHTLCIPLLYCRSGTLPPPPPPPLPVYYMYYATISPLTFVLLISSFLNFAVHYWSILGTLSVGHKACCGFPNKNKRTVTNKALNVCATKKMIASRTWQVGRRFGFGAGFWDSAALAMLPWILQRWSLLGSVGRLRCEFKEKSSRFRSPSLLFEVFKLTSLLSTNQGTFQYSRVCYRLKSFSIRADISKSTHSGSTRVSQFCGNLLYRSRSWTRRQLAKSHTIAAGWHCFSFPCLCLWILCGRRGRGEDRVLAHLCFWLTSDHLPAESPALITCACWGVDRVSRGWCWLCRKWFSSEWQEDGSDEDGERCGRPSPFDQHRVCGLLGVSRATHSWTFAFLPIDMVLRLQLHFQNFPPTYVFTPLILQDQDLWGQLWLMVIFSVWRGTMVKQADIRLSSWGTAVSAWSAYTFTRNNDCMTLSVMASQWMLGPCVWRCVPYLRFYVHERARACVWVWV